MEAANPFSGLDRYELRHLPGHLAEVGADDMLDRLFRLDYRTETRTRNAWFDVKDSDDAADNPALYTLDLAIGWRAAERRSLSAIERGAAVPVGTEFFYAALTASTSSLAARTPPILRAALLQHGHWSVRRALDDAERVADAERHIEALEALLPLLPAQEALAALHDALPRAQDIHDTFRRGRALLHLAALSPPDLRSIALREALDVARHMDEGSRMGLLRQIADELPSELSAEALDVLETVEDDGFVADGLELLARHLSTEQQPRALRMARALDRGYARAKALAALSDALPEEAGGAVAAEALRLARSDVDTFVDIAPCLAARCGDEILDELLAGDPFYRSRALAATMPHLSRGAARRGLAWLATIDDEPRRAFVVEEIVPALDAELFADAVRLALGLRTVERRARVLLALAKRGADVGAELHALLRKVREPTLVGEICTMFGWADRIATASLTRALDEALRPSGRGGDIETMRALAPALTKAMHRRTLAALPKIDSDYARGKIFSALVAHVPDELLDTALETAEAIGAALNPELLARLTGDRLARAGRQALRALADTPAAYGRDAALEEVVPFLPPEQLPEAAALGQEIADNSVFVQAMLALAAELPPEPRTAALREALAATREIENEGERRSRLDEIVARLPSELLADALDIARGFRSDQVRAAALDGIAPFLDASTRAALLDDERFDPTGIEDQKVRSWSLMSRARAADRRAPLVEALSAARAIWAEDERAMALAALAPDVPQELRGDVFAGAMTLTYDEYDRAFVLRALAPRASGALAAQVLDAAREIKRDQYRVMVLAPLVKRLPPHLRAIVRADAVATSDPTARASLLQALEAELAVDEAQEVRETARAAAREIEFLPSRAAALARLADGSRAQGRQALDAVSQIEDEHGCSISLAEITPFLASALADEIATMARAFAGARERARVLAALAAHVSDPARTELAHEAMAEVRDSDWQLDEVTSTLEPSLGSKTVNALLLELDRVSSDTLRARVAAQLPTQNLHDAWRASLTRFAAEDRQALLHRMEALIPQASALGGERVLIDIAQCLSQARRWWP